MAGHRSGLALICLIVLIFIIPFASARGEFRFDLAAQVAGTDNYTKHWSGAYPPDPGANIIIYSYAGNMSYKRMTAVSFLYVVYDPMNNVVAVDRKESFQRNYDPVVVYYTLHPGSDWIEGNYRIRIIVYDRIDRDAFDEKITKDPFGINIDAQKYKTFYETGANAADLGILLPVGYEVAQSVLNFRIDRSASIYPPDRFLLHDARFTDNSKERIVGEKFQIEVSIDNNYREDGSIRLAMLVDNNLVATKDVAVKGLNTSKVTFDAKAGKTGTFNLHFGADTPDLKFRNAELTFSIKNETDSSKLDPPKISITGMNVDKEFTSAGENVTVTLTAVNNGKTGSKTVTVYSNRVPVGSADVQLRYLEEKTLDVPIVLKNTGINRITVSDEPSLYRNVFVEEASSQKNPIISRLEDNPLKVSMAVVFMVFAWVLFQIRKRLT